MDDVLFVLEYVRCDLHMLFNSCTRFLVMGDFFFFEDASVNMLCRGFCVGAKFVAINCLLLCIVAAWRFVYGFFFMAIEFGDLLRLAFMVLWGCGVFLLRCRVLGGVLLPEDSCGV